MVLRSTQVVGEAFFLGPRWVSQGTAEPLPFLIGTNGDIYPAVSPPAAVAALNRPMIIAVAHPFSDPPVHGVVHYCLCHMRNSSLSFSHVNQLSLTRAIAMVKGHHQGKGSCRACSLVSLVNEDIIDQV